jgi:hypothetical protein
VQSLPPLTKPVQKRARRGIVLFTNAQGVGKLRALIRAFRNRKKQH